MSSVALIIRDDGARELRFSEAAFELRENALAQGALIGRVSTAEEQQVAVDAQRALHTLVTTIENAREACKQPVLVFGRKIDQAAKDYIADVRAEQLRISALIGDFQTLEEARIRAARNAENERLAQLERDREAAIAKAPTHEAVEAVKETFAVRAFEEARPAPAPVRAEGQIVKPEWEITITDIHALYRAHPVCCKLEARLSEIKALLNMGVKVHGVHATQIMKASVRTGREPMAITV